eukprot:gene40984-50456_t
MLVLGLFTRIAAAATAIQMFVIAFFVLWPAWGWTQRGMEYALFMGLISIAVFIRGGGRASIDKLIGLRHLGRWRRGWSVLHAISEDTPASPERPLPISRQKAYKSPRL